MLSAIRYQLPNCWISYDPEEIRESLRCATAAITVLRMIPFQRQWVEEIRSSQIKCEISGTSQIEGAEFLGDELETALRAGTHEELRTRSQKQAKSAFEAYKWVADVPDDQPISPELISSLHRLVVTGCDDDHCEPGGLRKAGQNVLFGFPRHRGVAGGKSCSEALDGLARATATTFRGHDPITQAFAIHYHLAAMHPFLDGNGRTARALEALMLQRAGLKGIAFVSMSNFYHRAQHDYLAVLAETRRRNHDLTPFLFFALRGLEAEASRLTAKLVRAVSKGIFREFLDQLLVKLSTTRKRVIVKRQLTLLGHLLSKDQDTDIDELSREMRDRYRSRKHPAAALHRDIIRLEALGAVRLTSYRGGPGRRSVVAVDLDWPKTMTEAKFFQLVDEIPKRERYSSLAA